MKPLKSKLEGMEMSYASLSDTLESHQFTLGGNWDYDHGYFDRTLDAERQTAWLRIPFQVPGGGFDPNTAKQVTKAKVGTPFVLRHQYQTGDDETAELNVAGALIDQFQSPSQPDADIDGAYIERASSILRDIEGAFGR